MSSEDAAEGDSMSGEEGYVATPTDVAAAENDPSLDVPVDPAIPVSLLPAELLPKVDLAPAPVKDPAPAAAPAPVKDPAPAAAPAPVVDTTTVPVPPALLP
jgi:hypothetical protein